MLKLSYLAVGAIAAGLVLTLVLASLLTPARWWRQLNLRAISIVVLGTWAIASLVMWLAPSSDGPHNNAPQMDARASAGVTPLMAAGPASGLRYRVYDDLNLRAAKGTGARRIAIVPAGSVVTTTGIRDGDWWQVSARVGGKEISGWSSSLWLRRADEAAL